MNGVEDIRDVDRLCEMVVEAGSEEAFSIACIASAVPLGDALGEYPGNASHRRRVVLAPRMKMEGGPFSQWPAATFALTGS